MLLLCDISPIPHPPPPPPQKKPKNQQITKNNNKQQTNKRTKQNKRTKKERNKRTNKRELLVCVCMIRCALYNADSVMFIVLLLFSCLSSLLPVFFTSKASQALDDCSNTAHYIRTTDQSRHLNLDTREEESMVNTV